MAIYNTTKRIIELKNKIKRLEKALENKTRVIKVIEHHGEWQHPRAIKRVDSTTDGLVVHIYED